MSCCETRPRSIMTLHAPSSFFQSMMPSSATPMVIQPVGRFQSPPLSAPQVHPSPSSSTSAPPPPPSSSFVAISPSTVADAIITSGRDSVVRDFYRGTSTSWHSVTASDSCGGGGVISGSGLHPLVPTSRSTALDCFSTGTLSYSSAAGAESLFGSGCGSSFTMALHHAQGTTPTALSDPPQQASGHLMATGGFAAGGGGSATIAAGSPYFGAFGTTMTVTPVCSDGLYPLASQPDTLQAMIYRRPFTGAKPPYSYISLITMAIQV